MLVSLVSQLVGYAVAAVCLQSKEARFEERLSDTSDGVAILVFAAVMGLELEPEPENVAGVKTYANPIKGLE